MYRHSGAIMSWWYPDLRSSFENTVAPFKVWIRSMVGVGWRSHLIALFAIRMSTHIRTSPFFFGITTNSDTHGVGPSTLSIMFCCSRLISSYSTFLRRWKEIRLAFCATGGTDESMWSLTFTPSSWPIPLNRAGYWLHSTSWVSVSLTWLTCMSRMPRSRAVV